MGMRGCFESGEIVDYAVLFYPFSFTRRDTVCSEWVVAGGWLVIADGGESFDWWSSGEGGSLLVVIPVARRVLGSWCLVWVGVYWMCTVVVDKQQRLFFFLFFSFFGVEKRVHSWHVGAYEG